MRLGYAFVSGLSRWSFRLLTGVEAYGLDRLPRTGKIIIASNHRSNLDPPLLGAIVPREVHFFAKEELFKTKLIGSFIRYLNAFPVRRGEFDRNSLTMCLDVLKRNGALIFFPEGTRAPADGFLKAKLGLGWVVALSRATVVPVYLHGTSEKVPKYRSRPGVSIVFGHPISALDLISSDLRGRDLYQSISDHVLEKIRELSLETPGGKVEAKGPIYDREIITNERLR
jgi:1-acyl-sn-glycerol-3-phosphate acyltransferase